MTSRRNRFVAFALGVMVLGATAALNSAATADDTVVLNESNFKSKGWSGSITGGPDDFPLPGAGSGPSVGLAEGPGTPPAGKGSYQLVTYDTDDSVTVSTRNFNGLKPSDLADLQYSTYRFSDSTSDAAKNVSIQLRIEKPNASGGQIGNPDFVTTLVFEPVYFTLANPVRNNLWQTWDTVNGHASLKGWWSTGDQVSCGQSYTASCTYAQAVGTLPDDAYIAQISLKAGSGWENTSHLAFDKIVVSPSAASGFTGATYDWESVFTTTTTAAPPTNQVPTFVQATNASFDAFNGGTYQAHVDYDTTPADLTDQDDPTKRAPLANAYVVIYLDTDGNTDEQFPYERIECAGFTDADGDVACSPPRSTLPRLNSSAAKYQAFYGGDATYAASWGIADASFNGLDLL